MNNDFIVFFGILFLLYSGGNITLTQLLIMLSLISTAPINNCRNDNIGNT